MRDPFRLLCGCVVSAALILGCGADGSGGQGGADLVPGTFYVFEFTPTFAEVPIQGAMICQVGADNCVASNRAGKLTIYFPADQEIAFTVEKEGYGPWVFGNVTDEHFPEGVREGVRLPMYTHEYLAAVAESLQTPYPWEGGIVALVRWRSPNQGVKFLPVGPTAEQVGDAFYFDAASAQYSLDVDATTWFAGLDDGPLGEGGFTEVVPGVQQFEFVGTSGDCPHASWGWPGDAPNRVRVPVIEGYTTYGSVRCDDEIPGLSLAGSSPSERSQKRD